MCVCVCVWWHERSLRKQLSHPLVGCSKGNFRYCRTYLEGAVYILKSSVFVFSFVQWHEVTSHCPNVFYASCGCVYACVLICQSPLLLDVFVIFTLSLIISLCNGWYIHKTTPKSKTLMCWWKHRHGLEAAERNERKGGMGIKVDVKQACPVLHLELWLLSKGTQSQLSRQCRRSQMFKTLLVLFPLGWNDRELLIFQLYSNISTKVCPLLFSCPDSITSVGLLPRHMTLRLHCRDSWNCSLTTCGVCYPQITRLLSIASHLLLILYILLLTQHCFCSSLTSSTPLSSCHPSLSLIPLLLLICPTLPSSSVRNRGWSSSMPLINTSLSPVIYLKWP